MESDKLIAMKALNMYSICIPHTEVSESTFEHINECVDCLVNDTFRRSIYKRLFREAIEASDLAAYEHAYLNITWNAFNECKLSSSISTNEY